MRLNNFLSYNQIKYEERCDVQMKRFPYLHSYIPCNNCIFHCFNSKTKRRECVNNKGFTYTHIVEIGVKK